jgi:H+/Cl- antiporter ClcA
LKRAATYLEVLGWLQLLGLNLGGILFIAAGREVRQRNRTWWWVAVLLCAMYVAAAAFIGLGILLQMPGIRLNFWGRPLQISERWLLFCLAGVFGAIFTVPLVWLLAPQTRRLLAVDRTRRCVNCGYDVRANTGRCPECGFAITCEKAK